MLLQLGNLVLCTDHPYQAASSGQEEGQIPGLASFPLLTFGRITSETDGLEECDSGAGAQVEEVLFARLNDGLALVPVVVHVEPLALVVRLTPARAFPRDPSVSSAVQPVRRRPDKMIDCKYTVWQT